MRSGWSMGDNSVKQRQSVRFELWSEACNLRRNAPGAGAYSSNVYYPISPSGGPRTTPDELYPLPESSWLPMTACRHGY